MRLRLASVELLGGFVLHTPCRGLCLAQCLAFLGFIVERLLAAPCA